MNMAGLKEFEFEHVGKRTLLGGREVEVIKGRFVLENDGQEYEFEFSGWVESEDKIEKTIEDFKKEMERSSWLAPMLAFGYSDGVGEHYILYRKVKKGEHSN
ncbi:protein of unknown function (plasmid) [Thermococcus nautili]|nr:protein of unknown function [Thermococcus nautili]